MSGGERQRARLAMVLAQETPVVLLDEPTSHLDMDHRYMLFEILSRIRLERGCAVIMVSHSLADAQRFGDSIIYIKDREARVFGPEEKDGLKTAITESAHVPDDWIY
jgi:iron complex transport system ATP-binding protein